MKTQVAIIGAGPAGMFLAHLLRARDIDSVVLERRDRDYVVGRVRAGVLEKVTVDTLTELGLDARLRRDGLVHGGTNLLGDGAMFQIDVRALTGADITVYGQQEVMKDLFDAAAARGLNIVFDAEDVALHDVTDSPYVTYRKDGRSERLDCDFIVGCDGSRGISRDAIPPSEQRLFERVYPFGWLGILADVPPADPELIYCSHANGFALASMRSLTRSRYYIQCALDENIADWPDERFWDELCLRLGPEAGAKVTRGPSFEKSIAPLRSFVGEPMRYGKLFLAGDAAHIVPPTGAKGMNLAIADVVVLAEGMEGFFRQGKMTGLDLYSQRALSRVWKAVRFSWWFTSLMHRFPHTGPFDRSMQVAELDYIRSSHAAQQSFAENYVGLPMAR